MGTPKNAEGGFQDRENLPKKGTLWRVFREKRSQFLGARGGNLGQNAQVYTLG